MSADLNAPIPALLPRTAGGHQFVFYGDSCSGIPGGAFETNFAAVNAALQRLQPRPEFVAFLGDHVAGMTTDYRELRRQWRHWLDHEMSWLGESIPLYHTTSNHNTYDAGSETVWREVFPGLPGNGPSGQQGLSYYVRRGSLLLAIVNTSCVALGGPGHVECEWLDKVLGENSDARHKLVMGHHPVHPVNGYADHPLWRIEPEEGSAFWQVLVNHSVLAYLCSHIIAFDVQVHDGVLQVTSGGAGTRYGPGGFMPGETEYHHLVQAAADDIGFRYQVVDCTGAVREGLSWPLASAASTWQPISSGAQKSLDQTNCVLVYRFSGLNAERADGSDQTLLCGWCREEGPPVIRVGLAESELVVELVARPGRGSALWHGPAIAPGGRFNVEVGFHPGMGPGGILWRRVGSDCWSSLATSSARGLEALTWPEQWTVGHGPSGPGDTPFRGQDMVVQRRLTRLPKEG